MKVEAVSKKEKKRKRKRKFQVAVLVNQTHVAEHVAMDGNGEKIDGEDENPEFSLYSQWRVPLKHHPSSLFHFFFYFSFCFSLCQIPIQVLNFFVKIIFLSPQYIQLIWFGFFEGQFSTSLSVHIHIFTCFAVINNDWLVNVIFEKWDLF